MRIVATAISILLLHALAPFAEAEPRYYEQWIPGATCAPSNKLDPDDLYVYEDRALVNTASETGKFFLAKCAISEFGDEMRAFELRVRLTGSKERQPQCVTYDLRGEQAHSAEAERSGGDWVYEFSMSEVEEDYRIDEQVSLTIYCLQPADTRLEVINLIWERI
ncbi:MAG: hypothetical protein GVY32_04205 [Gammaproteobacteria bacterium]|jgi:hypothetical protein|nr:hypothetical protein [Gammaproteobacteria bacterium]